MLLRLETFMTHIQIKDHINTNIIVHPIKMLWGLKCSKLHLKHISRDCFFTYQKIVLYVFVLLLCLEILFMLRLLILLNHF